MCVVISCMELVSPCLYECSYMGGLATYLRLVTEHAWVTSSCTCTVDLT